MTERKEAARALPIGIIRICPMRDGPCPHGIDCPHVGDGPYGYPCKDGWRTRPSGEGKQEVDGEG